MRHVRKILNEIIPAFLVIILLLNNIMFSFAQDGSSPGGTIYSDSITVYSDDMTIYSGDITIYSEDMTIYSEGMTAYIEEFTSYIEDFTFYFFGEYVNDIYIVALQNQAYIDRNTVIYDPDSGRQLNIGSMLAKFAIGTTVIIACVALNIASGGTAGTTVLTVAMPFVKSAFAGAAIGAAIGGTTNYIASGRTTEAFFEGAIGGAADGFMWGAIFSPGAINLAKAQIGRAAQTSRNLPAYQNFSATARQSIASSRMMVSSTASVRASRFVTEVSEELLRRTYPQQWRNYLNALEYYTADGFRALQTSLRNGFAGGQQTQLLSNLLRNFPVRNETFFRGENLTHDIFGGIYGLRNIAGRTPREIVRMGNQMIRNNRAVIQTNPAFTSTSIEQGHIVKLAAVRGTSGAPIDPLKLKVVRELRFRPGSTSAYGANISKVSVIPGEGEVLLNIGLKTRPLQFKLDKVRDVVDGEWHDVIRIIEEVL